MIIKKDLLTPNEWSRPQKKIIKHKAIVIHWTGNPGATAKQNRDFFEARKAGTSFYGSAHFIIDTDGEIIQCIPTSEIAYHVGTNKEDPKSKKIYTDEARERFGFRYTKHSTPNYCTIGIELCPIDEEGNFTKDTLKAAAELCAELCKKYKLTEKEITTHFNIVGWKPCPKLWSKYPLLLDRFRNKVKAELEK